MDNTHSVTELLDRLQDDEHRDEAAHDIWTRFIERLVRTANAKLKNLPRRSVDEEDVAQAAFDAFFQGVKEERFTQLNDRHDLWQVLVMLTERKAIEVMRRELAQKRGGGKVRGESVFENLLTESSGGRGISDAGDPHDEWADFFTQDVRQMLDLLDPTMKQLALLRLEGKNNSEIASELGITLRSTERKVRLIKDKWLDQVEEP